MFMRVCLGVAMIAGIPVWSQVAPSASGGSDIPDEDSRMQIPPMVSAQAFPTSTRSEERSNFLDGGMTFEPAYNDNLLPSYGVQPISGMTYSIKPSISLDKLTARLHQRWAYNPGITIYPQVSSRNEEDQSGSLDIQSRLSQHVTISGQDSFSKSSNVFNQPDALLGGQISGSPPSSPADVIFPFADRLTNMANAEATYQFSRNGMIGAGGTTTLMDYLNQAQYPGLYNSNSRGGSAFYDRRFHDSQYVGVTYQYLRTLGNPATGELKIQTQTLYAFYNASLPSGLFFSLSAGPQNFDLLLTPLPASSSWTPAVMASAGRQGDRTNFAASYSRSVSGGGGLLGAFSSNTAGASARLQLARTWSVESTGNYSVRKNVSPQSISTEQGGHSVSGTVSFQHPLGEHISATFAYQRLHQSYSSIAAISSDPDNDRESVSISYQFTRPLGR